MPPTQSCGKFILGGEHSVLTRGRALAFPIPQLRLDYTESPDQPGLRVNGTNEKPEHLARLYETRKKMGVTKECAGYDIQSSIPLGSGLGSSAALCTAIARFHFAGLSDVEIAQRALEGEKVFHGRSSGVDPFVVSLEKPISYRAHDQDWRELRTEKFKDQNLCFVLKDSGVKHKSVDVIGKVQRVKSESPLIWEDLISMLATNAQSMIEAFENDPARRLGALMNDTHFRLLQLGASTEVLDDLTEELKKNGALGAKLTGAGGGGFVLALFERAKLENLKDQGSFVVWEAR